MLTIEKGSTRFDILHGCMQTTQELRIMTAISVKSYIQWHAGPEYVDTNRERERFSRENFQKPNCQVGGIFFGIGLT